MSRPVPVPLEDLRGLPGLGQLSPRLLAALAERGLRTLDDLRQIPDLRDAVEGTTAPAALLERLEGLTRLSPLRGTPADSLGVLRSGFRDVDAIAGAGRARFLEAVGDEGVDAAAAERIHGAARAQAGLVANAMVAAQVAGVTGSTQGLPAAVVAAVQGGCGCERCRSATGPLAYLADLLNLALRHLRKAETANGLTAEYFSGTFGQRVLARVDGTVDFDWSGGPPAPGLAPNAFSVRWSGTVRARASGACTFRVAADSQVENASLWVDGRLVVDRRAPIDQAGSERSGQIVLDEGRRYDLRLEYVSAVAPARVRLGWSSYGQPDELIPRDRLFAVSRTDPIDLSFLEERFHQPFRALPETCETVERSVRQVRICTEILRDLVPAAQRTYAPRAYLQAAYETLLLRHGTSYGELRQVVRANDPAQRAALSARLGFLDERSVPANDHLGELFLDPTVPPDPLSERTLDDLFGYRDTTRPPLEPDVIPAVETWRLDRLRELWLREDHPAGAPPPAAPLIDPDLIGAADLVDGRPSTVPGRAATRPMDLLEDREAELLGFRADVDRWRRDPRAGFDGLITDTWDDNGNRRGLGLGAGISLADFDALAARRAAGNESTGDLALIKLDGEGFDLLAATRRTLAAGGAVTPEEWEDVYSVFVARLKRAEFPTWRSEERTLGIALTPQHFRIRPPPRPGFEFPWRPRRFRSTTESRRAWQGRLRSRIEAIDDVRRQIRDAVSAAEEAWLVALRDSMRLLAQAPVASGARTTWLTDHLQIDTEAGIQHQTTRVGQAIETLQGALHGARTGLLETRDLVLDDPATFDGAWRWMGSYATWRATLRVLLHPENALRPTLRRDRTAAFDQLVDHLRAAGRVHPELARTAAAEYERFFRDVCGLEFVAVAIVPGKAVAKPDGHLLLARARDSGRLYSCVQDEPPAWWRTSGFRRSLWTPVPGLDGTVEVLHLLSYRDVGGNVRAGLYASIAAGAGRRVVFTSFDGSRWTGLRDHEVPSILCSSRRTDGVIPKTMDSAGTAGGGWRLSANDRIAILDLDGDGRRELLIVAATTRADGRRPVAMVRERGGGLEVDVLGSLPAGWDVPTGAPLVLRTTLVQSPDRRREQLLVVARGVTTEVGLLGLRLGTLELVAATENGMAISAPGPLPGDNVVRIAADIDGDGFSELLLVERMTARESRVTVLNVREQFFAWRMSQTLGSADPLTGDVVAFEWERVVALPLDKTPGEAMLVVGAAESKSGRPAILRLDGATQTLALGFPSGQANFLSDAPPPIGFPPNSGFAPFVWLFDGDDGFLHARLGLRAGDELLLTAGSRPDSAVLVRDGRELRLAWRSAKAIPGAPESAAAEWNRRVDDVFVAADVDGDGRQELLVLGADGRRAGLAARAAAGGLAIRDLISTLVRVPGGTTEGGWRLAPASRFLVGDLDGDGCEEIVAIAGDELALLRGPPPRRSAYELGMKGSYGPSGVSDLRVLERTSPGWHSGRPSAIRDAYLGNAGVDDWLDPDTAYLDEAYQLVPLELGLRLSEAGHYTAALDWLRTVYDYEQPLGDRKIAYGLVLNGAASATFDRGAAWLRDPLDSHAIAATRRDSHTRFVLLAIVRCLLDYADAEFTRATSESLPRARELYIAALQLLDAPELRPGAGNCAELIGSLTITIGEDELRWVWRDVVETLGRIRNRARLADAVDDVRAIIERDAPLRERLATARARADEGLAGDDPPPDFVQVFADGKRARRAAATALLADRASARELENAGSIALADPLDGIELVGWWEHLPAPSPSFCVEPNPVVQAARDRARLNLEKLRAGRSIAGLELRLPPYALPTAAESGASALGSGTALPALGATGVAPLPYRYGTLLERARQLLELARQLEAAMFDAIRSAEQARYEELQARQGLALTRSGVRLREIHVSQTGSALRGAERQRDRVRVMSAHYRTLIDSGISVNERTSLGFLFTSAGLHTLSAAAALYGAFSAEAALSFGSEPLRESFSSLAAAAASASQIAGAYASFERRAEDWQLQLRVSQQDVLVADEEIRRTEEQVRAAEQEHAIAELEAGHAEEVLEYLTTRRLLTADLLEWVGGVLEQIYRYLLQQATAMAQTAEQQLAFERQESPPALIQADYWEPPERSGQPQVESRGLTGSARLLRDLTELDQYGFRTAQRKLQLTKRISLAELDPIAFARFQESGALPFTLPMSLFDRDFPGHYLRLIQRVRTSVIALVPPVAGIHATLATTGTSEVVIGRDLFETVSIQRGPESVALTAPVDASGLFELNPQPELLAPFEGIGVAGSWMFTLPRASNQIDFSAIADVLIAIEYTALESYLHRQAVIRELDGEVRADRAFLFSDEFADAWYDLHNPGLVEPASERMVVRVETRRTDFPPNIEDLTLAHAALYFARADGESDEVAIADLEFTGAGGARARTGPLTSIDGVISTRRPGTGNLPALGVSPAGEWRLSLNYGEPARDAAIRERFELEKITGVMLVISYRGTLPPWPD